MWGGGGGRRLADSPRCTIFHTNCREVDQRAQSGFGGFLPSILSVGKPAGELRTSYQRSSFCLTNACYWLPPFFRKKIIIKNQYYYFQKQNFKTARPVEWTTLGGCLTAGISVIWRKNYKYVCLSNILIGKMEVFYYFFYYYFFLTRIVDASSAGVGLWNHWRENEGGELGRRGGGGLNKQTSNNKTRKKGS